MDAKVIDFLEQHSGAVMTTVQRDGAPHVARIDVGLVDGRLWSSATQDRVRTGHLRRNPMAALCVLDAGNPYRWLGLKCRATILEGPDAPQQNLALYRAIAGEPDDLDEYLQAMVSERRIIFEFDVEKAYGSF